MSDPEANALVKLASDLSSLPAPAKTTFLAAASRILGGLASFPAAWLRRPVQKFEDTTDARSLVAQGLAKALVEQSKENNDIMRAVAEAYLPDQIRKIVNKADIVAKAADDYASADPVDGVEPNDDWLNQFIRYAEDASSERLKVLYGKILAGEIIRPGSFSPATLRAISELTQELASDFSWAWEQCLEQEIWLSPDNSLGSNWDRLARLRDAGLLSPVPTAIHQPKSGKKVDGCFVWAILGRSDASLQIATDDVTGRTLGIVNFTTVGQELGSLLPSPDSVENLRRVAAGMSKTGVSWVKLVRAGGEVQETVWSSE